MKKRRWKKRYSVALITIGYVIFKIWATCTLTQGDDKLPEQLRDALLKIAFVDVPNNTV